MKGGREEKCVGVSVGVVVIIYILIVQLNLPSKAV